MPPYPWLLPRCSSVLKCGSCLLFPARAGGCLLLISAHPVGSAVRLRDPAKADRQGSHPQSCHGGRAAEREGMEWSFCRLPATVPAAWDLPASLPATSGGSWTPPSLSATSHPPCQATPLSCCLTTPCPLSSPHSEEKAQSLKRHPEALSLPESPVSDSLLFLRLEGVGGSWGPLLREPAATSLLTNLSAQGRKDNGFCAS